MGDNALPCRDDETALRLLHDDAKLARGEKKSLASSNDLLLLVVKAGSHPLVEDNGCHRDYSQTELGHQ